jgi:hypothetical protein
MLFAVAAAAAFFYHVPPTVASRHFNVQEAPDRGRQLLQSNKSLDVADFSIEESIRIVGGIPVEPPHKYPYIVALVRFRVS